MENSLYFTMYAKKYFAINLSALTALIIHVKWTWNNQLNKFYSLLKGLSSSDTLWDHVTNVAYMEQRAK